MRRSDVEARHATDRALDGLGVEIADEISGPYCGKLLADLGADVTKIEAPEGDPLRRWGPFPDGEPDPDRSGLFEYLNAGKRGASWTLTRDSDAAPLATHRRRRRADRRVSSRNPEVDRNQIHVWSSCGSPISGSTGRFATGSRRR